MKTRIGEVLFSQLLPYVGNMKEIEVQPKIIVKIIETILEKYPFIDEAHRNDVYKMICSQEEVTKIKEELKNDEELKDFNLDINIVKEFNKNIIDPIKLTFDSKIYGQTMAQTIESECIRQIDKTNNNRIGYFHQYLFKLAGNG